MKKILLLTLVLCSSQVNAWIEPFSPYGMMPYGMGYGMYGYGMMYPPIQVPSFNYQTTIVQQPAPIIVQQPAQPQVIYRDRVEYRDVCDQECERLRRYFGKK